MKKIIPVLLCCFLILYLAASIDGFFAADALRAESAALEGDTLYKILGGFRDYLSWMSLVNADSVFHGGIRQENCPDAFHFSVEAIRPASGHREDEHDHSRHAEDLGPNILPKIAHAIAVTEHKHLTGAEEREILPWLYYTVKLNPHNELAYVLGGYWVGVRLKKPSEAVKFLLEGVSNNPNSWRIHQAIGEVYYMAEGDFEKALRYLERAKELSERENIDKFDKRVLYVPLAEAYARIGKPERSLELYEELLTDFPNNQIVQERIGHFRRMIGAR
ncbi:MAG: tetratricopeptide repeat protein [Candidatus Omnitrophota bacterium]